jgi:hypothetical protein
LAEGIPGHTVSAIHLALLPECIKGTDMLKKAQACLGEATMIVSRTSNNHEGHSRACWLSHFRNSEDGIDRMQVLAPAHTVESRAKRIAQRVWELETDRLKVLRGVPLAKQLSHAAQTRMVLIHCDWVLVQSVAWLGSPIRPVAWSSGSVKQSVVKQLQLEPIRSDMAGFGSGQM